MPTPGEYKTLARILTYAEMIDWMMVSRMSSNGSTTQTEASPISASALVNQ
jgi:hypothetical protein